MLFFFPENKLFSPIIMNCDRGSWIILHLSVCPSVCTSDVRIQIGILISIWIQIRIQSFLGWIQVRIRIWENIGGIGFTWNRIRGTWIRIQILIQDALIRIWFYTNSLASASALASASWPRLRLRLLTLKKWRLWLLKLRRLRLRLLDTPASAHYLK